MINDEINNLKGEEHMVEMIKISDLKVRCNINIHQLHHLSIREEPDSHATADITVSVESDELSVPDFDLKGQPIMICVMTDGREQVLFNGVMHEVNLVREAEYDTLHIFAYSLSWLMDIEKKSRSFQNISRTIQELITDISKEYSFQISYSAKDKKITAPFIQYEETDWEFLLRLSSHLSAPSIPASNYQNRGIYIGFPDGMDQREIQAVSQTWCMDKAHIKFDNWRTWTACYHQVRSGQIYHLGEQVTYENQVFRVHRVHLATEQGILRCNYRLADKEHQPVSIRHNRQLNGVSLTGMVLERRGERIKLHLNIDEQQDAGTAYDYLWLPDYGSLVYCMPEAGSKVRLLIPDGNEQDAIAIHCVRQSGPVNENIQNPACRLFVTKEEKKMALEPGCFALSASVDHSQILLQDGTGGILSSQKGVLIQARGNLKLTGGNVVLKAPKEITSVCRRMGSPTVVNICHNLDSMGNYTSFKNLPALRKRKTSNRLVANRGKEQKLTAAEEIRKQKEIKKLELKMKELKAAEEQEDVYYLGDTVLNVIAAVPQVSETDELSRIAMGFRPIVGRMRGIEDVSN